MAEYKDGYVVVIRSESNDEAFVDKVKAGLQQAFPKVSFAVFGVGLADKIELLQVTEKE